MLLELREQQWDIEAHNAACHAFSLTRFKELQSIANIASTHFIQFYLKPVIYEKV